MTSPSFDQSFTPNLMPEQLGKIVQVSIDDVFSSYIWSFFAAFLLSFILTPVMRQVAMWYGIIDRPDLNRKMHRAPVAYLGGVAVFVGWMVGVTMSNFTGMHAVREAAFTGLTHVHVPLQMLLGAFFVVLLGLWDDIVGVTPKLKIVGQVAVAVLLLSAGIGDNLTGTFVDGINRRILNFTGTSLSAESVHRVVQITSCLVTVSIVVFCCNAANLMDGLDGLCGGVTAIIAAGLLALSVYIARDVVIGDVTGTEISGLRVVFAIALLGGVLGFLPYNFNPASIFMGDAGSLFLGFCCATMIVLLGEIDSRWLLAAFVMFSLPVLDTALAFARRALAGRPLFSADKAHFHHQLVSRGLSVKQAVLVAYTLSIFFVICGMVMIFLRTRYAVAFYMVLFCFIIVAAYKIGMVHERVKVDEIEGEEAETSAQAASELPTQTADDVARTA